MWGWIRVHRVQGVAGRVGSGVRPYVFGGGLFMGGVEESIGDR